MTSHDSGHAADPAVASPALAGITLPAGFEGLTEHPRLLDVVVEALDAVEAELSEAVSHADELADTTSRHLLEAGGKRIRPLLTILASLLGDPEVASGQVGEVGEQTRRAAVVMELTHLATLYHDDVMDEAPVRRGAPTAHRMWGNSVAILAGDLLFARASQLMATLGPEAVRIQADTFERLVLGQLRETVGPADGVDELEHYLDVLAGKTGSLIAACGIYGAGLSGADEHVRAAMETYGERIGVAFQLADDIIDITSPSEVTGKTTGTDLREGVLTLPVLMLRRMAEDGDASAARVLDLVDADLTSDDALAAAVEAICAHEAVERSWAVAQEWVDDALRALEPLPASAARSALEAFGRDMVHRSS